MRFYLIWLAFIFMSCYAWKNWFKSACFLLVSMAILERPDMPQSMLGITGFSPWNILFISIFMAMLFDRERKATLLPGKVKFYCFFFVLMIVVAGLRELDKLQILNEYLLLSGSQMTTKKAVIVDHFINTLKYFVPFFFFFYGAKDKEHVKYALIAVVGVSLILALQVIKVMPFGALASGHELEQVAIRKIDRDIGYYRSDLAVLFAGAAWAIYFAGTHFKQLYIRMACNFGFVLTVFAMGLTGGRIGIGAWLALCLVIAWFKMRKLILIGPLVIATGVTLFPPIQERFLQGLANDGQGQADLTEVTSGRADIWPYVIDKIGDSLWIGYGRNGMQTTGLTRYLEEYLNKPFAHPHNAYLQLLMDSGLLLTIPVLMFFFLLTRYSFRLFRDKRNPIYLSVGGCSFALLFAHLVGSLGSQSFYPVASSVPFWCCAGMMLRLYVERDKLDKKDLAAHQALYSDR